MSSFSTTDTGAALARTRLLLGDGAVERIAGTKVILFGVGGVGSWCAESLVRSGIRNLTIVDCDSVAVSNINRQLQATSKTVGLPKTEVLRNRLLEINPNAEITALQKIYTAENADEFDLQSFDYVIDAIDSLRHKAHLILKTTAMGLPLFSSMGAALKMDPGKISVSEFRKVYGCPLARALRKKFKQSGQYPARKFICVYSPELLQNQGDVQENDAAPENISKPVVNGTIAHITAIFGFTLAGLVIQDIVQNKNQSQICT